MVFILRRIMEIININTNLTKTVIFLTVLVIFELRIQEYNIDAY